eukprot:Phypoly_transcript_27332.p1 GENE.Phypoly_transcript_27332~~Phypoly_transcript_27332.p1  ORF type:complete len:102 (+),score=14.12 Phypoly_transcript_27332:75-380(+)
METPGKKVAGWDISVFKKQFYISTGRARVFLGVVSLPFIYNYISVARELRENKEKNNGRFKFTPKDAVRIFGVDFVAITFSIVSYIVLKQRGGLSITRRYK